MPDTWDAGMQQHFEQLQRSLTDTIAQFGQLEVRLTGRLETQLAVMGAQIEERLEQRLGERLERRIDARMQEAEGRLGLRFQVQTEQLRELVRTAADNYGGVLEGIQRDLANLNRKMDASLSDHRHLLANHGHRLVVLERITGVTPE